MQNLSGMKAISAGRKTYTLYYLEGIFSASRVETGSCYIEINEKNSCPKYTKAKICTVSGNTNPDWLFIKDRNDTAHAFIVNEMQLVCLDRDVLIVIWAIAPGEKRGPVIAIKNSSTAQAFFCNTSLKKMYSNNRVYIFWIMLSAIPVLASASYQCTLAVIITALSGAHCVKKYLATVWADAFKKNFDFENGWNDFK